MPWTRLKFLPGVVKDRTNYSAEGTWTDSNLVRFRQGLPEKWNGWIRVFEGLTMEGICRAMHRWSDLSGFQWMGAGTHRRFYVISDDLNYDVTPIESSATLGTDPLDTTDTTSIVNVNHTAHGRVVGDVVIISGATAVGGIGTGALNAEHEVYEYIDADNYTIDVGAGNEATSTASGGGASVLVKYLFHAGSADQIYGGGYGSLGWGEEEYGGDPAVGALDRLGIWSIDNWGEDLIANANKGPIFYWDATSPSARMVDILDLASADGNAPEYAEFILVSHKDRHLLAFGGSEYSSGDPAPMAVRWCSQEDILDWDESSTTGTAGSLPFSRGSRLIAAKATQQEIVVWTDLAMYSLRYIGAPLIYGTDLITDFSDIVGMKAACNVDSDVYWMGRSGFYRYTGRVEKIPCTVWDYISGRINLEQGTKVYAATNRSHDEVIWFYPSTGDEIDSYVAMELSTGAWSIGTLSRTSWIDADTLNNPMGTCDQGVIYEHDVGSDDGTTVPATSLGAYIESAPIELSSEGSYDKGDRMMFIRRIFPDLTFRGYSDGANTPSVNIVLKMVDKPGGGHDSSSSSQVSRTAILPVEEFTDDLHVRLRGRAMVLRIEGATVGTKWRLGVPRIDVRTDGQR